MHATNSYVSHLLPHLYGPEGVVPTRGQAMALRAAATPDVITKAAWASNEGFEYWFPRPVKAGEATPLVILGGGREVAKPRYELYEVDDAMCNEDVSMAMRKFLSSVFPGKYDEGREPEIEWVCLRPYMRTFHCLTAYEVWCHGLHEDGRSIRTFTLHLINDAVANR